MRADDKTVKKPRPLDDVARGHLEVSMCDKRQDELHFLYVCVFCLVLAVLGEARQGFVFKIIVMVIVMKHLASVSRKEDAMSS